MASEGRLEPPKPPGDLYPGVKLRVIKRIIREIDANVRLTEIFGKPASDRLALVHRGKQFVFVNNHEIDLSDDNEREFEAIMKNIYSKYKTK
jgi:hypothetical protein